MSALFEQKLQECDNTCVALSDEESLLLLQQLSQWSITDNNRIKQLGKVYKFKDFRSSLAFANQVAELAESINHHPCICIEWGKTTISWWTHSVSGLFINDFIMAAKCDQIYQG